MNKRCGFISLTGRPNVGKSTLLNSLLGKKISITSEKPQTTRHRILGIKTTEHTQYLYVDTPGLHQGGKNQMNRIMNRAASRTVSDVDIVVFVVDANRWSNEDEMVVEKVCHNEFPVIVALNKIDDFKKKDDLLLIMDKIATKLPNVSIIPVSALKGEGIADLERAIDQLLPESEFYFPKDQTTDRSDRFLASEIIREKLMRDLADEVPYQIAVEIEKFKEEKRVLHIAGLIWVEREGQKAIIIGKKGERLKRLGQQAREDMARLFGQKIYLQLWVKVRSGWSDDIRALHSLGYKEDE